MVDKKALDETFGAIADIQQPYQAFALVGYYLTVFSAMETALDGFIGKLLGLSWAQERIVMANYGFAEKVHTARALLAEASSPDDFRKDGDALLATLLNVHAAQRNEIAHGFAFGNDEEGGALLPTFRARSKAREGVVVLTLVEARHRVEALLQSAYRLTEMGEQSSVNARALSALAAQDLARLKM